ncbi:MAG: hypothetical protein J6A09_04980, partial [Alphaproteobacteria bacterium]|nr:hypothetical protein [Alphaproteobacteria bacterium]
MTTGEYIYNTYGRSDDSGYTKIAKGTIYINNNGAGNVYGLYAPKGTVFNSDIVGEGVGEGYIEIINNKGNSYGLYGKRVYQANTSGQKRGEGSNYSSIKIANIDNRTAIGMYGTDEIINSGDITIHNLRDGTAVGIYADGANTQNRGTITITRDKYIDNKTTEDTADDTTYTASNSKGGLAIGIYGTADSQISNTGIINISGATNAYGIYSEGGTVENTGTIQIDGNSSHPNAIKLNGGKLFQDGMLVSQNLSLNDFGGEVVASENSKFIAENNISGDLSVSNSLVKDGFDKTYTAKDVINASDTSDLHLNSKSALFNAELAENNSDIVMKMKDFNDVVDNKSIAGFLGDNYNEQNNEKLFNSLKGIENAKALNKAVDDMTGKQMFNRFAFEDLSQIREFNADMNNKLFNNQEKILSTSGNVSPWMLNGASDSQTKYSLNNMTIGNNSIGLAIALTDTNSKDNQGQNSRHDKT